MPDDKANSTEKPNLEQKPLEGGITVTRPGVSPPVKIKPTGPGSQEPQK